MHSPTGSIVMIEKANVQEEIYLKELERLMNRRPDLVMQSHKRSDEIGQWNLISCLKIYKDEPSALIDVFPAKKLNRQLSI